MTNLSAKKNQFGGNYRLLIKVCGMTDPDNIAALVQLPIDYIGFIFYEQSVRYIGKNIDKSILNSIPESIKKVGVFVNAPLKEVLKVAENNNLQCIQLHGNEIPDYCNEIKDEGYKVIKAFRADHDTLTCETARYRDAVDYLLFDTPTVGYGGGGQKFKWEILKQQILHCPFFLSGGIGPGDEKAIKELDVSLFHALDLNSKFEIEPGIKNIDLLKRFVENIKYF
jgi:phosphoribosylanthranilate isomerase